MGLVVGIAGASGYAGGELLRYLAGHPHVQIGPICAATQARQPVTSAHPGLVSASGLSGRTFDPTEPGLLADGVDLVFVALPHGQSAELVAQLPPSVRVVDLGADFRLADPSAWAKFYPGPHAGSWPYGLPELPGSRAAISSAIRVASPGCYATAVALGLSPLLAAGLVHPEDVVVVAASGTTGAGRSSSDALSASTVMGAVSPYQVGGVHRHIPEMEQALSAAAHAPVAICFTPLLAPMPRGILATCTARLADGAVTSDLRAALHASYDPEKFVHVLPDDQWPTTKSTNGTNHAIVQVAADTRVGRAVVTVALDNLGKGAAGQAIQNANLLLGLAEDAGFDGSGAAP